MKRFFYSLLLLLALGSLAGCGASSSGGDDDENTTPIISASKLNLTTDRDFLNANGDEVATLTILARDENNAVLGGVIVTLSSTSGVLSNSRVETNETGQATVTLSAGPDFAGQTATVTATSGNLSDSQAITFSDLPGVPTNISLATDHALDTLLSQGEQASIFATVTDAYDKNVEDGTIVLFTATSGTVTRTAVTLNGVATATFQAGNSGGIATITGSSAGVSDRLDINVAAGNATSIAFFSSDKETISVKGSGLPETTLLTFEVLDGGGSPVADNSLVNFEIATPLGGGETLSAASDLTQDGFATVQLQSGTVAGAVSVRASVNSASGSVISTRGQVLIVAGRPDSNHFSLAAERLNVAGYTEFGLETRITAFAADRYSNPVPAGTPIFFSSEAGAMDIQEAFTNQVGQASASHITQEPFPDTPSAETGLSGSSKILAWTAGQEAFVDLNGNGIYDSGEPFEDLGEPFIDFNDNQIYDGDSVNSGERYADINLNGRYDGPNGVWDGETFTWNTIDVLWSYADAPNIKISTIAGDNCPGYSIPSGESCEIYIYVEDSNDNPLIGSTQISLTSDLLWVRFSPSTITVPDTNIPGNGRTMFPVTASNRSSNPRQDVATITVSVPDPESVETVDEDGTVKTVNVTFTLQ